MFSDGLKMQPLSKRRADSNDKKVYEHFILDGNDRLFSSQLFTYMLQHGYIPDGMKEEVNISSQKGAYKRKKRFK